MVTFNQNLYDGQLQGLTAHLDKALGKLRALQLNLERRREGKVKGGKAPTLESVKKQIHTICSAQLDFIQFREGVKGSGDAEQMHERKLG